MRYIKVLSINNILLSIVFLLTSLSTNSMAYNKQDTIKVGILHSLSGDMAISESVLKDALLMLIEEQNSKGGLLGKQLEAIVLDPESNWPLFAEKARQLIEQKNVDVIFGCWTSVSRKHVLPVVEELNHILFYPVQYEGQESSRNIFYTGASPNQQALPAIDYLIKDKAIERWVLMGTDYLYPRTVNKIITSYLNELGVDNDDIMLSYTPFGFNQWQERIADIKRYAKQGKKTAIVSTINGVANVSFYQEIVKQKINANELPIMAFSISENELSQIGSENLTGHLVAWNYVMDVSHPNNTAFIQRWQTFQNNKKAVTNDPIEAHYIGFELWLKAVNIAQTTESNRVIDALIGLKVTNLSGGEAQMLPNHHITKPFMVGRIEDSGKIKFIEQPSKNIPGDAWSDFILTSKYLIADWTKPVMCGRFNKISKQCK
ncbi:ABC transporter substrate-binding protein [Thalassotalea sp. ND16A]|uniref:ABC transporter substrate-binding protein n=1 Tax=Thalassotalea sp. ND16A TaxID=1535422 RepID=UPI00051A596A|nr:transporter substrate-binding protein [Thalassotalea sp. ND16A]KGJ98464.1 hypothetical protein ND16A_0653 [Thalassotalea sp. ND16A]